MLPCLWYNRVAESRGGEAPRGGMRVMNENLYIYLIILLTVLEIIREIKK